MLARIVTGDEFWVHHYQPEKKRASMHPASPARKRFKVTPSSKEVMLTVFWNHEGILLTAFHPQGQTVNADSYCNILRKLRKAIQRKRPGLTGPGKSPLVPRAAQRILCRWFSGAYETLGQVPQCTGSSC
jgi:hypothetical protein